MKTQCPNCKAKFNVDEKFTGKQAKCPKCTKPFTIQPFLESPAVTAPPAESPKPVEKPAVAKPQPLTPVVKTAPPADPPASVVPPVKSPIAAAPDIKTEEPAKKEQPESQPVSKPLKKSKLSKIMFVYAWIIIRLIAGGLAGWGLMLALNKGEHSTLITAFAAADAFLLLSILLELLLFYKMWSAIADKQMSVTPAKAVGFLFIPVFNLYWALNMIMAFAEDYNSFIERSSLKTKDLPPMLFMLYAFAFMLTMIFITVPMLCVFTIVSRISGAFTSYSQVAWLLVALAVLAGLVHFVTYIISAAKTCDALNSLTTEKTA